MDVSLLLTILGYVAPPLLAWIFKDKIMEALNIKKVNKEIDSTTSDTIDKNLQLYQKMLDDYAARKEAEDIVQRARITELECDMKVMVDENHLLRLERDEKDWELTKLHSEVLEIKNMLSLALKQLDYYKQNSDLELPEDLQ